MTTKSNSNGATQSGGASPLKPAYSRSAPFGPRKTLRGVLRSPASDRLMAMIEKERGPNAPAPLPFELYHYYANAIGGVKD